MIHSKKYTKKVMNKKKIQGHIENIVKFEIRGIKKGSRKLYSCLNFIEYQLVVLADL